MGENSFCECGSGKKYKLCCMYKNKIKIKPFDFLKPVFNDQAKYAHKLVSPFIYEPILDKNQISAELPLPIGLKSYCIYRLKQIVTELNHKYPDDKILTAYYGDLYLLFYKNIDKLENRISKTHELSNNKKIMNIENENLSFNEQRFLLENAITASLLDYAYKTTDYGASKALLTLSLRLLEIGITDERILTSASLITNTGDELVNWELEFTTDKSVPFIDIEFKPLDILDNEYQKKKTEYPSLSDESLKAIATAITQEVLLVKSQELMSYSGLAMSYFGVLERELKAIIVNYSADFNPKMMWRDITEYFKNKKTKILTKLVPNIYKLLKIMNPLRNKAAHGEFISKEEFELLKSVVFNDRLLEYISWELAGDIPEIKKMKGVVEFNTQQFGLDINSIKKSFEEKNLIEKHSLDLLEL